MDLLEWNERTLAETLGEDWLQQMPLYVQQAYAAKKYAFVSDYMRLWALEQYGGVYLDTDVEVIRSFDELPEVRGKIEEALSLPSRFRTEGRKRIEELGYTNELVAAKLLEIYQSVVRRG